MGPTPLSGTHHPRTEACVPAAYSSYAYQRWEPLARVVARGHNIPVRRSLSDNSSHFSAYTSPKNRKLGTDESDAIRLTVELALGVFGCQPVTSVTSTFTTTRRPSRASAAKNTRDIPPPPSSRSRV